MGGTGIGEAGMSAVGELIGGRPPRHSAELLPAIAAQATQADRTRTVSPDVIAAIKASDLVVLAASKELGGLEESIAGIATELEAVAGACASTAWCLWNHLAVFHLYCGALGPAHLELLAGIVERHEWVCFPAGAGSKLYAREEPPGSTTGPSGRGGGIVLEGSTSFGSGSRYADWAGVAFAVVDPATGQIGHPPDLRFSIVELHQPGVDIDPTWDGASLRASSTDDVRYHGVTIPPGRWAPWWAADRAGKLRDPALAVIHQRYREDWVGLSDLWLAAMATGVTQAALEETAEEVGARKAIMGRPMSQMAGVHFNLGRAATAVLAARSTYEAACAGVDARIDAGAIPTEADHLRQMAASTHALAACEVAMGHLRKVMGGNGLREGHRFERRQRDLQAMPLHINAHEDRVSERVGRYLLGLDPGLF
jgi:alkylation response protein AidB-like acyl-CoA dehydrogenase